MQDYDNIIIYTIIIKKNIKKQTIMLQNTKL
jgi:hypothetical protein